MAVPYTFSSATSAIPLSQLDSNFATTITLGNTAVQLGNTVTTLNNMTLANVTITTVSGGTANAVVYTNSSGQVTANASVIALDSSGNLGLGVTPSAWGTYKAMQIGSAGVSLMGGSAGVASFASVGNNFYFDGSSFRYVVSAAAGRQNFANGAIEWYIAPSGTAGNAISFTQAMTLDASGRLGIGTSSPSYPLDVVGTGGRFTSATGIQTVIEFGPGLAYIGTLTNHPLLFQTNETERARIDSSGNFIQSAPSTAPSLTTNGQMVFNLTSNTNLRVSVRGSDGVTRTANITLA